MAEWTEVACEPRLVALDSLFAVREKAPSPGVPATLLEAAGDVGEVRLAARVVRRHLDAGVLPNHIAIVVHGGARRYRELIREVFEPAGIPIDAAARRTVGDTSMGALLIELLNLAIIDEHMTRERSLSVARSAHVNLHSRDRDRLHHQILTEGFLGIDGWDDLATRTLGNRAKNRINRLKRAIADARLGFSGVTSAAGAAAVVRKLGKDLHLVHNVFASRNVIPSGAPEARSRGIADVPTEGPVPLSGGSRFLAPLGMTTPEDFDSPSSLAPNPVPPHDLEQARVVGEAHLLRRPRDVPRVPLQRGDDDLPLRLRLQLDERARSRDCS
jgi:hypothetical protein